MRRDTLVYSVAGTVFGLVVGYMAASFDVVPRPAAVVAQAASAPAPVAPAAKKLHPDEVAALESLAARQPKDASARVELGNLYMDAERWDDAVRWYREALALDPSRVETATDLGACLLNAGRPAEGLLEFERVLAKDPQSRSALYNKGIALQQMGRGDEAAAAWEELLKRHPDDPQLSGLPGRIRQLRAASGK
jgi:cytochrome c-type biogenesis protein CcmH/NrfG